MSEMYCDFCSRCGAPAAVFPAETFVYGTDGLGRVLQSTGAWAACSGCVPLVNAKDWAAIGEARASLGEPVAMAMFEMWHAFDCHRRGAALPAKASILESLQPTASAFIEAHPEYYQ